MKRSAFAAALLTLAMFNSCKKDEQVNNGPVVNPATGIYVLSEGSFGGNNTTLGYYSIPNSSFTGNFFGQQNPGQAGLGDHHPARQQAWSELEVRIRKRHLRRSP